MDVAWSLRSLARLNASTGGAGNASSLLPNALLETIIPGYSIISSLSSNFLGAELGYSVTAAFILFAIFKSGSFFYGRASDVFASYLICTITIEAGSDAYLAVMEWLSTRRISENAMELLLRPEFRPSDGADSYSSSYSPYVSADGKSKFELPNKFQPMSGTYHFWFHRRLFFVTPIPGRTSTYQAQGWAPTTDEKIIIHRLGRSTDPIKEFIKACLSQFSHKTSSCTVILRPSPKSMRWEKVWRRVSTRPSRSIDTVVLDQSQKDLILKDMAEYLQPNTATWYADRGIPYRRGYLFYGPPGTGKTSLSVALAGHFRLDIYCISLRDSSMTEEDLHLIFEAIPAKRALVLLEDIDTAGLSNREELRIDGAYSEDSSESSDQYSSCSDSGESDEESDRKNRKKSSSSSNKSGISLSSLLNSIDGVASPEGRILIMTTNSRRKLDAALLRPGRADLQIGFSLAGRDQMVDIFERMFQPVPEASTYGVDNAGLGLEKSSQLIQTQAHELRKKATKFAQNLPENELSPAAVQGYLLTKKGGPDLANDGLKEWKKKRIEDLEAEKAEFKAERKRKSNARRKRLASRKKKKAAEDKKKG